VIDPDGGAGDAAMNTKRRLDDVAQHGADQMQLWQRDSVCHDHRSGTERTQK
jgi:hypothetical protein